MKEDKLIRDHISSAVLNADVEGYMAYKKEIEHSKKVFATMKDVDNLKNDVNEIKSLLKELINGLNKNG